MFFLSKIFLHPAISRIFRRCTAVAVDKVVILTWIISVNLLHIYIRQYINGELVRLWEFGQI